MLASSYGWTWEQFLDHTMRQVMAFFESAMLRKQRDRAFQVSIVGGEMKVPPLKRDVIAEANETTEKDRIQMTKSTQRIIKERVARARKKHG